MRADPAFGQGLAELRSGRAQPVPIGDLTFPVQPARPVQQDLTAEISLLTFVRAELRVLSTGSSRRADQNVRLAQPAPQDVTAGQFSVWFPRPLAYRSRASCHKAATSDRGQRQIYG